MGLLLLAVISCFVLQPSSASCGCWHWPAAMPMPCSTTQSPLTPACCWQSRGTWPRHRMRTETREYTRGLGRERGSTVGHQSHFGGCWGWEAAGRSMELSQRPPRSLCRPLHLAIIHEQTAVIKQLIEVIVSIPSQQIINISNNLQQVHVTQSSWFFSTWGLFLFPNPGGSHCCFH